MKTTLQVPMDKALKSRATRAAKAMGFSSLQETVRVFLQQFTSKEVTLRFKEPDVQLSPRAARRYAKMIRDIESGRVKTKSFTSVDALMRDLQS